MVNGMQCTITASYFADRSDLQRPKGALNMFLEGHSDKLVVQVSIVRLASAAQSESVPHLHESALISTRSARV
jgi:hypothetical protein